MISKRRRFNILKRDKFRCQYCGRSAPNVELQVDHIEPVSRGGENENWNLITACRACNIGKSNHCIDKWWVMGKQSLLASGDASFRPFDEIADGERADYQSFREFCDRHYGPMAN